MADVIIHIGLPKTATTTLQTCLFAQLHNKNLINYIGKKPTNKGNETYQLFTDIFSAIVLHDDQKFNDNLEETITKADDLLQEGVLNVISDEIMAMYFCQVDIVMKLKRIKTIFQNHKINLMLSLRKQDELAYSLYVELYQIQFYQDKENNSIEKFISNGLADITQGYFLMFCYDKVLAECANQFGSQNTTVLLFEDIKNNQEKYHKQLAELLAVSPETIAQCLNAKITNTKQKHKAGYQSGAVKLDKYIKNVIFKNQKLKNILKVINKGPIKYLNQKIMRSIRMIPSHSKTIPYLSTDQKDRIMKEFIASNQAIDTKYDLGLKQYDYY